MIGLRAQPRSIVVEADPEFTFSGGPKYICFQASPLSASTSTPFVFIVFAYLLDVLFLLSLFQALPFRSFYLPNHTSLHHLVKYEQSIFYG
jgi:hypothetical protein